MKILIVDDSRANQILLSHILDKAGHHDLIVCASAEQAYAALGLGDHATAATDVDLILMDIVMPGIDGIAACRRIKSFKAFAEVPVIMVTANTGVESLQAAFDAGAMDYITKPVNRVVLLARVGSALKLKREIDRRKAREREIAQIGASIQQTLLLGHLPQPMDGIDLAAGASASELIDGDFYDFFQQGNQILDVVVADVMGKGVPAALLGAATKAHLMRAVTHLASVCALADPGELPEPQAIVGEVHRHMTPELICLDAFVTLCYARIDLVRSRVGIVDAGHCKAVHFHYASATCSLIHGANMPLGFDPAESYDQVERPFCPGDMLIFYSDGITEARNAQGEIFGSHRLMACAQAAAQQPAREVIRAILDAVAAFSGSATPTDDLTCVVLKIQACDPPPPRRVMTLPARLQAMPELRRFINAFCDDVRAADPSFAFCLKLAVHELAVNIIRHSLPAQDGPPIAVEAFWHGDRAVVQLLYKGSAFQAPTAPCLPLDAKSEGGYGLFMIAQCADDVVYSRRGDGLNCVTVIKHGSPSCTKPFVTAEKTHGI